MGSCQYLAPTSARTVAQIRPKGHLGSIKHFIAFTPDLNVTFINIFLSDYKY